MKKVLLSAALLGGMLFGANAQVEFGPKIGLNLASQSWAAGNDDAYGTDQKSPWDEAGGTKSSLLGLQIGLAANAPITESISIRPELLFSQKGFKFKGDFSDFDYTATARCSYIEVPVNVSYGLPIGENKLEIYAGPYIGFALGGKFKIEFDDSDAQDAAGEEVNIKAGKEDENSDDVFVNPIDAGLNFGVGFRVSSLLISANYGLGLSNVNAKMDDYGDFERGDMQKLKNRVLSFSVAYFFGGE